MVTAEVDIDKMNHLSAKNKINTSQVRGKNKMTTQAILTLRKVGNRKFSAEVHFNGTLVKAQAGQRAAAISSLESEIRGAGYDKPFPEWTINDQTGGTVQAAEPDSNPFAPPTGAPKVSSVAPEDRLPNDQLLALYEKGKAAAGIVKGKKCRNPDWKAADAVLKAEGFRGGMVNLKRVVYAINMQAKAATES